VPRWIKAAMFFLVRLSALGLAVLALVAWVMPSDVVRLISKEEFILFGRYGMDHFHAAVILTILAVVACSLVFASAHKRRRRGIAVVAWSILLALVVFSTDLVLRLVFDDAAYVHVGELRLRPPGMDVRLEYVDQPLAQRSLPRLEPGFPPFEMRMRTDARGLRNPRALDSADILLLGDSFTEGSRVGDEDIWATRIARHTGMSVYNLANSGDDPQKYLAKYDLFGQDMGAHTIILMLYEGNDFRREEPLRHSVEDYDIGESIANYFKFAPIRVRYERLLRALFGPIRSDAPVRDRGALGWLPFEWRVADRSSWYFVRPRAIAQLFTDAADFAQDPGWLTARTAVDSVISAAARKGTRVIVAYAPTKERVMFPLAVDDLDADAVLRYLQLAGRRPPAALDDVRDADQLKAALARFEGGMENVVAQYYRARGIKFVSLTDALVDAARDGVQTYFSYDQHWTPEGHRVVAEELLEVLGH
jgi:hypothetical protein